MVAQLPTIKQLQYFVALHDHGHFGKAAESCLINQSTLSSSLRELEIQFGVTLVERTHKIVRFTPLGVQIAEKARRVLRETEELTDLARADVLPLTGELRLGVIPTIAPFLLPAILPHLRVRWPKLKLFLRDEIGHVAVDALHRGQIDCVLLAAPFICGEVEFMKLFEDELLLAFPSPELRRVSSTGDAIRQHPLLLLEQSHCLTDHSLLALKQAQLRGEVQMIGTSLHTLVQMVDNGLGFALIPQMAVSAGILDGTGIHTKRLRTDHSSRQIALAWRKGSSRGVEFRMLGEAIIEAHKPAG